MSQQLDTIKAALTDLTTAVTADTAAIDALVAKLPTAADDAEAADITKKITDLTAGINSKVASIPTA